MVSFYYLSNTKKNKKMLKLLKDEGFISHFYSAEKKIKIFLKQDLTKSFGQNSLIKRVKYNLKIISSNEIWGSNLKPGIFLVNTAQGVFSERIAKRKIKGGSLLSCIR